MTAAPHLQIEWYLRFDFFVRENLVRFLQGFFRADVIPEAGNDPGVERHARIKPLHETARLVGIIALGDVLLDQRQNGFRIIIERDAGQSAGRILWFLFEESNFS